MNQTSYTTVLETASIHTRISSANKHGLSDHQLQNLQVVSKVTRGTRPIVPYAEDSEIVGREDDVSKVMNMLIDDSECENKLPVIAIRGLGGQGKTTLAQLVFDHQKVKRYFDKTIWVRVSNDFSVERLLDEMLQSLTGTNGQLTSVDALVNQLREQLRAKKYLLVLDDVWNDKEEEWNGFKSCLLRINGSKESKILATTRSESVTSAMRSRPHLLGKLPEGQDWKLFEKCAFANGGATRTPQLVSIGKRILERCGGVPLAIKAIGGLLFSRNSESEWLTIERSAETWSTFKEGNGVLSAIKLSYDHLPSSSLKQCFAHCAIFEKGAVLKKDELIQHWMAQGLLNPGHESLQMEDTGSDYCKTLMRNSLFLDAGRDDDDNITAFKLHDLVQDVLVNVSKDYCFHMKDWKVSSNKIEAVHVLINNSGERGMCKSLKDVLPSRLRTLHLKGFDLSKDLFENFQCLSVLIVDNEDVKELPDSIGEMKHLRFLDISHTGIKTLPKSFAKLYHLQTLRVWDLIEVPDGFGNLINLRHIYIDSDKHCAALFPGLSKLRNLRTLPYFVVGKSKGCQIEELENLDNLRGKLKILSLQNVGSVESAAKCNLSEKSNIRTLELYWDERVEYCDEFFVMEGLKPHFQLKGLTIDGYRSAKFPTWMVDKDLIVLLLNLTKLTLKKLDKCEKLLWIGHLPCLEYLEIESLHKVKCIEQEFYGSESTMFPALRILKIKEMRSVVEWSDAIRITPTRQSSSSSVEVEVFPRLEEMDINGLPSLSVFPNLGSLPHLRRLTVSSCENLTISYSDSNSRCYFPSLHELSIEGCDKLAAPFCSLIFSWVPLESLVIKCNPNSWPKDLQHLNCLKELHLEASAPKNKSQELQQSCFPWPYPTIDISRNDFNNFVSLTSLELNGHGLPKVTFLPYQIQYVTTLMHLTIKCFDKLEALPDWLHNLECLQILMIGDCKNLMQLPSKEAFDPYPSNLQTLCIYGSPLIIKRYNREHGSEWHKIAHIRCVILEP